MCNFFCSDKDHIAIGSRTFDPILLWFYIVNNQETPMIGQNPWISSDLIWILGCCACKATKKSSRYARRCWRRFRAVMNRVWQTGQSHSCGKVLPKATKKLSRYGWRCWRGFRAAANRPQQQRMLYLWEIITQSNEKVNNGRFEIRSVNDNI